MIASALKPSEDTFIEQHVVHRWWIPVQDAEDGLDGVFENDYATDEDADETDDEHFSELNVPFDSDLRDSDEIRRSYTI